MACIQTNVYQLNNTMTARLTEYTFTVLSESVCFGLIHINTSFYAKTFISFQCYSWSFTVMSAVVFEKNFHQQISGPKKSLQS